MDLKEANILGGDIGHHWYYSAKAKAMLQVLGKPPPSRVLDVGAGSGFFSRYLLAHTNAQEAWCVDISYEREVDDGEGGKRVHYRRAIEDVEADLVLLMDVLEHVDDDVGLLKEYVAKVPEGARFLVTVPAFQFLWSGHDEFLEHKRRYTLNHLKQVMIDADLKVEYGAYYFGLVFPLAAALRLAQKVSSDDSASRSQLKKHHPIVNSALKAVCNAERLFMNRNRAAGLTVFCVARKS